MTKKEELELHIHLWEQTLELGLHTCETNRDYAKKRIEELREQQRQLEELYKQTPNQPLEISGSV